MFTGVWGIPIILTGKKNRGRRCLVQVIICTRFPLGTRSTGKFVAEQIEMTNQPRCTLHVSGLDCPGEVQTLRAALEGASGVDSLGFDLINGLMTVDYDAEQTGPEKLLRLVNDRAGMEASLVGQSQGEPPRSPLVDAE